MSAESGGGAGAEQAGQRSGAVRKQIEAWGRTLLTALVLGVPTALINWLNAGVNRSLTAEPWRVLLVIGPLAVFAWWCWRVDRRGGAALRLRGPFALFLLFYLSAFTLAASSDLLVWRRTLVGFDEARLPRSWIAPARIGDLRYRVAQRPRPDPALLVVAMDPPAGETREAGRFELARLIAGAAALGARGVALDFWFDSIASDTDADVCRAVANAAAAGTALVLGLALDTVAGRQVPRPEPPELAACLPAWQDRGHLLGYREADGRVRSVPLRLEDPPGARALGLQVAAALAAQQGRELDDPAGDLFHFLEPADPPPTIAYADLAALPPAQLRTLLDGRFLLVGERSGRERFATPYGTRLGVEVHASVIQSLLAGRSMRRVPWWSSLLVIVVACFIITHLAANGARAGRLVQAAALVSALMVLAAAGLARFGVWVDVVYVVAAVWPLVGLLAWRGRRSSRPEAATARELQPAGGVEE